MAAHAKSFLIATRSSELALRQARQVQAALARVGIVAELKTYKTAGDKKLDEPLNAIGGKGLFTRELEVDLARGAVQCCVHSLKDLPTEMADGLTIGAVLAREDPRDVLIVNSVTGATTIADLPRGSRVGTSSLRRRAQLMSLRADVEVVALRGNVPTRIRKVDDGQVHAAILAAAGVHRLGISERIASYLDAPQWLPAAGQGAIAVQIREDDEQTRKLLASMHDEETSCRVRAERAFLGALEGGCQVPIGAVVQESDGELTLFGMIADVDGRRMVRGEHVVEVENPELAGIRLANDLRSRGATEILEGLRRAEQVPAPQPE